jgi:hypothetical protein
VQQGYVLGDKADFMLFQYLIDPYATLLVGFWSQRTATGVPILDRTILVNPITISLVQAVAQRRRFVDGSSVLIFKPRFLFHFFLHSLSLNKFTGI